VASQLFQEAKVEVSRNAKNVVDVKFLKAGEKVGCDYHS
jgi:hypothetical protein